MTRKLSTDARRQFTTRDGRNLSFSLLGFGSAPLGNYLRPLSESDCDATLEAAWDSGMRYFDTAPFYGFGLSETRVGRLLKKLDRSEYVISTKVGRLFEPCAEDEVNSGFFIDTPQLRFYYDYSYDGVMRSYEESLGRLGIDNVDILYVHDVDAFCHDGREGSEAAIQSLLDQGGWRALTELRDSGAVSAIGTGVNEWQPCARLLELADPDLFLLAGRYTLLEQEPIDHLFPQCAEKGAGVVIGGPYNSGILAGLSTYNYAEAPAEIVAQAKAIDAVCQEHGVPLIRAALHFVAAPEVVVSVIPGGQNVKETTQNAALLDEEIPSALWDDLKARGLIHPDSPVPA
ncbi:MAG TPA: aldo/keto reductase [Xanthomonadales bacterium]|nr:aldo/keto reductase [Xanthomonadales bacterium]